MHPRGTHVHAELIFAFLSRFFFFFFFLLRGSISREMSTLRGGPRSFLRLYGAIETHE